MSSLNQPFGLRPAYHPSGQIRPVAMTIVSGFGSNILNGQPVLIAANGTVEPATVGSRLVGIFMGVEFTDVDGRRRVSSRWPANTVATDIVAYVTTDPAIVYEIQANAPVAQLRVGEQADFANIAAGSAVTGLSEAVLDVASFTAGASAQMRVLGITPGPDNVFGDLFTVVQVQISEHQNVADRIAY